MVEIKLAPGTLMPLVSRKKSNKNNTTPFPTPAFIQGSLSFSLI